MLWNESILSLYHFVHMNIIRFLLYIRHVAFHGTTKEVLPLIFKAGLVLLKPGDHTINGDQLGIRAGHIPKSFKRYNKYSKEEETFDPNQIYVSPSIKLNVV